jgi:hypothetical protein
LKREDVYVRYQGMSPLDIQTTKCRYIRPRQGIPNNSTEHSTNQGRCKEKMVSLLDKAISYCRKTKFVADVQDNHDEGISFNANHRIP